MQLLLACFLKRSFAAKTQIQSCNVDLDLPFMWMQRYGLMSRFLHQSVVCDAMQSVQLRLPRYPGYSLLAGNREPDALDGAFFRERAFPAVLAPLLREYESLCIYEKDSGCKTQLHPLPTIRWSFSQIYAPFSLLFSLMNRVELVAE